MIIDNKNKSLIHANDINWLSVGEGVERKVLGYDEQIMMVCVRFKKGAIGALHYHSHRQVSYIESGVFEVIIDNKTEVLKKGDCYFVAPGLVHGVVALEDGELVDVFTPYREDFL